MSSVPIVRRLDGRPTTVLVADDDPANRHLLEVLLGRAGYTVVAAPDGLAALDAAAVTDPDLVLLDVQMPGADGLEVTRRLRMRPATAQVPIVLLTGLDATADKIAGLDAGATDFVTKPFDHAELLARVRAALRTREAFDRLEDAQAVLVALANAVEAKDPHTEHHCNRLAGLALDLARSAALPDDVVEAIGYGAALHDIGKIGVPEAILHKPGSLSDEEWAAMRLHSTIGSAIVAPLRLGRSVAPIVRGHHERWDGTGYPDGLRGAAIPIGARVVGIVDAFDAIVNDRPYRPARSAEQALEELRRCRGSHFDADLVDLFVDRHDSQATDRQPAEHVRGLHLPAGRRDRVAAAASHRLAHGAIGA